MKTKTTLSALLLLTTFVLRAGEPARFTPAKAESSVTIHGTSSLHEWEMKGTTIGGAIETDPELWKNAGDKPAVAKVAIPVASVRSEHDRMDRIMREALKASTNPNISFEMTTASLVKSAGDSFVVRGDGKLSIAGMTRDVVLDVTVQRTGDGRYVVTGQAPIRMTDYGIKPPVAMMGTLKTGNDVTVSFRWIVERS
jgi:polyisoprenoid-binding protein YceI